MSGVRRATDGPPTSQNGRADAVFVVGMHASGVDLLGDALSLLGLPALRDDESRQRSRRLGPFNDRLLTAATGPGELLPAAAPPERCTTWRSGYPKRRTSRAICLPESTPWVWADPRLSFLAPFWSEALNLSPAVILVHRAPWAMTDRAHPWHRRRRRDMGPLQPFGAGPLWSVSVVDRELRRTGQSGKGDSLGNRNVPRISGGPRRGRPGPCGPGLGVARGPVRQPSGPTARRRSFRRTRPCIVCSRVSTATPCKKMAPRPSRSST